MQINYQTINYPVAIICGEQYCGGCANDQELVADLVEGATTLSRDDEGGRWAVTETTTAGDMTYTLPAWDINNRCEVTEADVWRHLAWCAIAATSNNFSVEDAEMVADMLAEMDEDDPSRPAYEIAAKELRTRSGAGRQNGLPAMTGTELANRIYDAISAYGGAIARPRYDGYTYSYHLDITADEVSVREQHRDDNAVSASVYHGETQSYELGPYLPAAIGREEAHELALATLEYQPGETGWCWSWREPIHEYADGEYYAEQAIDDAENLVSGKARLSDILPTDNEVAHRESGLVIVHDRAQYVATLRGRLRDMADDGDDNAATILAHLDAEVSN